MGSYKFPHLPVLKEKAVSHLAPAPFLPYGILFTTKHQENFVCTFSSPIRNPLFNLAQVGLFSLALTFHWNCHGCLRLNLVTNFQYLHYAHAAALNTVNHVLQVFLFDHLPGSSFLCLLLTFPILGFCSCSHSPSVHSPEGIHTPQSPPLCMSWLLEWFRSCEGWSLKKRNTEIWIQNYVLKSEYVLKTKNHNLWMLKNTRAL